MGDGLFPYPLLRRGQAEFLADARRAVDAGAVLLAQVPTGLGKTAVALTATLEAACRDGRRVLFATGRRSQHRMAVETVRRMARRGARLPTVDLVAREAMCPTHEDHGPPARQGMTAFARTLARFPLHVQETVTLGRRLGLCPYRASLQAARQARLLVCDYNHAFGPPSRPFLRAVHGRLGDLLLVVDEAHNLPGRCREVLSCGLRATQLAELAGSPEERRRSPPLALARILRAEARYVGGESKVPRDFLDRLLARASRATGTALSRGRLVRWLEARKRRLPRARRLAAEEAVALLTRWDDPDHLRLLTPSGGGGLALRALDPRPAAEGVFRQVGAALLMSGTLHPGEMYVDLLAIPPTRARVRSYPPAFPPENRLLVASPGLSLAYKRRPGVYGPVAQEIRRLCEAVPGNAAAFFPSYETAREVGHRLGRGDLPKRLLWERRGQTKAEKEGLLRTLEAAQGGPGCLLLAVQGGSLSEGIDYPGDLLRTVLVAGLALSPPALEVEALRRFYARLFGRRKGYEYAYLVPALQRLVQCAGRCIRGPEDVGAVVILDRRVLRPSVRARLPPGFLPEPVEDLATRARSFFYERQVGADRGAAAGRGGRPHPDHVAGAAGGGEAPDPQGVPASRLGRRPS